MNGSAPLGLANEVFFCAFVPEIGRLNSYTYCLGDPSG